MTLLALLLLCGSPQSEPESALERIEREITDVVEKVRPSVVQVTASLGDEAFQNSIAHPLSRKLSGIIVSADGHILTDLGAVESARTITVTLHDGRRIQAERHAFDRATSLALLRIRAGGIEAAEFADADSIRQGTFTVLVSNPAGLRQSFSVGFLSGLHRTVRVNGIRYEDLIQTSAAVQSGDAGGLLANARGRLVGMIHSRFFPDGLHPDPAGFLRLVPQGGLDFLPGAGGASVGFATPAPTLKFVVDRLLEHGKVVRGWAGLAVRRKGADAVVSDVALEGPAARSGLRVGDILAKVDGHPVTDLASLKRRVVEAAPESKVRLFVRRGESEFEIDVVLEPEPGP